MTDNFAQARSAASDSVDQVRRQAEARQSVVKEAMIAVEAIMSDAGHLDEPRRVLGKQGARLVWSDIGALSSRIAEQSKTIDSAREAVELVVEGMTPEEQGVVLGFGRSRSAIPSNEALALLLGSLQAIHDVRQETRATLTGIHQSFSFPRFGVVGRSELLVIREHIATVRKHWAEAVGKMAPSRQMFHDPDVQAKYVDMYEERNGHERLLNEDIFTRLDRSIHHATDHHWRVSSKLAEDIMFAIDWADLAVDGLPVKTPASTVQKTVKLARWRSLEGTSVERREAYRTAAAHAHDAWAEHLQSTEGEALRAEFGPVDPTNVDGYVKTLSEVANGTELAGIENIGTHQGAQL